MGSAKRRAFLLIAGGLTVLSLCAVAAWAQTDRATIAGTVRDETGAALPGASVRATNTGTNVTREALTDEDGRYIFPSLLEVGKYRIAVSLAGFQTAVVENIELRVSEVRTVDVTLKVGEITEEVVVTAEAAAVETETSARGAVIIGRQITELPLNGRNYTTFATLIPGVSRTAIGALTDNTAFQGGVSGLSAGSTESARFSRSQSSVLVANGMRPTNNNFSIDGVDNNEPQYAQIGVFPPPDAIQEFRVETSVPSAEVGRAGGAVVNTLYKSGTNDFHGSAYYFWRNDVLDARPTFSRGPAGFKPPRRENEFGFTAGGPIFKNRTFFFADYQGQRNKFPFEENFFRSVPTLKSRQGDFSEFTSSVLDPDTGRPFPGNIIPRDDPRLDRVALNYLQAFDQPNRPGVFNNFFKIRQVKEKIDAFDIKIDHIPSSKQTILGRFSFSDQFRDRESLFAKLPAGFGAGSESGSTRQVALGDTYAFSPSVINDFRFGYTRVFIGIFEAGVGGTFGISPTISRDLGIPNVNRGDLFTSGGMGIGTSGSGSIEFTGDGGPFIVPSDNWYWSDKLSAIRGPHSLKAGVELRWRKFYTFDGGRSGPAKGFMGFDAGPTSNAQASMILGRAAFAARPSLNGPFTFTQSEWGFFVQDDWKVSQDLIFNLGLRYEVFTNPVERFDRQGNFDLRSGTIRVASADDRDLVETDFNNLSPRFGFAYAIGGRRNLALRGGYGMLYFLDAAELPKLMRNPPNTAPAFTGGTNPATGAPIRLGTGPPIFPGGNDPINLPPFNNYFFVDPDARTSYVHQYNLTVQWEFSPGWILDLGYVGNRSKKLLATRNIGAGGNGLGIARDRNGNVLFNVKAHENRASSAYDALQIRLEKRFGTGGPFGGLYLLGAYTYGHTIDESTGDFGAIGEARGAFGGPLNPLDARLERADSSLDQRHRVTLSMVYDLPFGRGRSFLGNMSRGVDAIIGGWQLNTIFVAHSGQPYSVLVGSPSGDTRPDLIGDPSPTAADRQAGRSFNPAAFAPPSRRVTNFAGNTVVFGTAGRNILRGPHRVNFDVSLFKNTRINERVNLQIGIEFFNFFNTLQKLLPNNFLNFNPDRSVNFDNRPGETFNAYPNRQGQLRIKIIF